MIQKAIRQQFADTMLEIGRKDARLIVLVGDISHFKLQPFARECPGQYYNVGICEQAMIGMGAGMSKTGFFPVIHTIAPFIIERAFEQIKLDFCYQQLCGNLISVGSAFDYANLGCTHHCYGDFALLKTLPGVQIVYPSSAREFHSLFSQTYNNSKLTYFRIPEYQHRYEMEEKDIKFGEGVLVSKGSNITIIAVGPQLQNAIDSKLQLAAMGWDAEIVYIHTIAPLDAELIYASVSKTKKVLVVEEHMSRGGVGDDVLRAVHDIKGVKYCSLSIPDSFVTGYGTYYDHCKSLGMTSKGIIDKVESVFGRLDK